MTVSGPARDWVSVWVGDFTEELALDGYLGPAFRRDHGCVAHENSAYGVHTAAMPLGQLLAEHAIYALWGRQILAVAASQGVSAASCSLVYLHYRHVPAHQAPGPLRFVGSVQMARG